MKTELVALLLPWFCAAAWKPEEEEAVQATSAWIWDCPGSSGSAERDTITHRETWVTVNRSANVLAKERGLLGNYVCLLLSCGVFNLPSLLVLAFLCYYLFYSLPVAK